MNASSGLSKNNTGWRPVDRNRLHWINILCRQVHRSAAAALYRTKGHSASPSTLPRIQLLADFGSALAVCMYMRASIKQRGVGRGGSFRSLDWRDMVDYNEGFGFHKAHFDDNWMYWPVPARAFFGDLLKEPWLCSVWIEGGLRFVPRHLWPKYVDLVRPQFSSSPEREQFFQDKICRPAALVNYRVVGKEVKKTYWEVRGYFLRVADFAPGCYLTSWDACLEVWPCNMAERRFLENRAPPLSQG